MSFSALQPFLNLTYNQLLLAAPYLSATALLLGLVAVVMLFFLHRRFKRLMRGKNGDMEELLKVLSQDTKELKGFRAELERYLKVAESRLRKSIRGVGVVRFNPFESGAGGNQSFALCLLDEEGSGVVLSTLYARGLLGVYAKPIERGISPFELSREEQDALARARAASTYKTK